ncbi:MAG: hypothetical protein AAF587_08595 [Bacteroidota bacterium]
MDVWFGILELPFLLVCIYFSFRTAASLKGGIFGNGMKLLAWGFLVMAIGHLNMQMSHHFGFDLFVWAFPDPLDTIFWYLALITTWFLSALGFIRIYHASKS